MLETFAARLTLERLHEEMVRAMESQVAAARQATPTDVLMGFTLGLEFHDVLVSACGNQKVVQFYEILKRHLRHYQHFAFCRLGRDQRALEEHADMARAFRSLDLAAVEHLLRVHRRRSSEEIALLLPLDPAFGRDATPAP
jgi:DNA-binding GntR family transcriptional regulator